MPIFIDDREPEEIINYLRKRNLDIEIRHSDSGDYVFGEVAIERKELNDLIKSLMPNKQTFTLKPRFWDQMEVIKNTYKIPILIIEGLHSYMYAERFIKGVLNTLTLFWKIPYLVTMGMEETAMVIGDLYIKYGVGKSGRIPPAAVRKAITPKQVKWMMLQCVKGIGPTAATRILEAYPDLFHASYHPHYFSEALNKVKGLNKRSKELLKVIFTNWCVKAEIKKSK